MRRYRKLALGAAVLAAALTAAACSSGGGSGSGGSPSASGPSLASTFVFGAPPDCATNKFCAKGLKTLYGIEFKEIKSLDFGGPEKPVARVVSTASGSIDPAGASVTAVSVGEGFRFGDGLLTIASGTSRSVTTYTNGAAKPETKGELVIEGAKVGDQAVTIGPDGVHPAGQTVRSPGGADQLNQALAAAGITVRTLSLQTGDGGAYGFRGLAPGTYTVQEVLQNGWTETLDPTGCGDVFGAAAFARLLDFEHVGA